MDAVALIGPNSHVLSRERYMDRNQNSYDHTKACTAAMTPACLPKSNKSLKQKKQTKTIHVSQFKREKAIIVSLHFYLSSSLELKTREICRSTCSSRGQRQ